MWTRVYAFGFLSALYLDQFIWFVYLPHLGYSPAFIGFQYAVMQGGRFVLDVPSSLFADRFGGRGVLVGGALAKLAAAVLFLLAARGAAYVLAGAVVTAVALTLPAGVDLAYVRGLATRREAAASEAAATRRFADYVAMQRLASLSAGLLGGLIASRSFAWLYVAEGICSLLLLLATLGLPGAPRNLHAADHATGSLKALQEMGRPSFRALRRLGVATALLWALSSVGTEYSQALLATLRLHPFAISLGLRGQGRSRGLRPWLPDASGRRCVGSGCGWRCGVIRLRRRCGPRLCLPCPGRYCSPAAGSRSGAGRAAPRACCSSRTCSRLRPTRCALPRSRQ